MTAAVIVNAGAAILGPADPHIGEYLAAYDPDAHDGRGRVTWTADPAQAMVFASGVDAWTCWRSTSTVQPLRPDGRPNRPLTAYTISVVAAPPGSAGAS